MGLIHWWPLNGDTRDYGLYPCTVTGTPTFDNTGKIGLCLSSGTLTMPATATAQCFNKIGTTIAFWWFNGNSSGYHELFGTTGMTHPNNRRFTLFRYPTNDALHWSWQNYDSDITFIAGIAQNVFTVNKWHHICEVWDNGTARFYVNGALVATESGNCYTDDWAYDTVIARAGDGMKYNDIRIYDHALSATEVRELAKGLILHYTFDDPYVEYTTNYVNRQYYDTSSGGVWGGHTTNCYTTTFENGAPIKVGNQIDVTYSGSGDGGFGTYCCTCVCAPSTEYTYSIFIKVSDNFASAHPNFLYHYEYANGSYVTEYGVFSTARLESYGNGWYRAWGTFTTTSTTNSVGLCFFTYPYANVTYLVGGMQFERTDHMTPYTWNRDNNYTTTAGAWGWNNAGTSRIDQDDTGYGARPVYSITQTSDGNSAFCWSSMSPGLVANKLIHFSMLINLSGNVSDNVVYVRSSATDDWLGSFSYQGSDSRVTWPTNTWIEITCDVQVGNEGVYLCTYTNNNGEKVAVNNWFAYDVHNTVYDSSGYGYNGSLVGDCQSVPDTKAGTRALFNHGLGLDNYDQPGKAFVLGDFKNEISLAQLTISFWANIIATFANHSGVMSLSMSNYWPTDYQDSGLAQYDGAFRVNTTDGSPMVSQNISFNEWHHYALVYNGATLDLYKDGTWIAGDYGTGNIKPFRYLFLGLNGAGGMWRKSQIKWGDFKMYATALSAADIQSEYQRKAAITNDGTVITGEIVEPTLTNLMDITSYGIATQTWTTGLSNYTQANCQVSLTADGYRIYRTPNHDGQAIEGHGWDNWGGMRLMPLSIDANLLKKYHRYILKWHVKGQTCDGITGYWTNNMGWGGGGLDPSPSNVETVDIPSGFIGEKDCYYRFTINDDVYKVCTTSYAGFVQGETYPSYRDFAFGCGYSYTNELGTDLYITNIRLYDITNLTEQEIQVLTTGVTKCEDIYEAPDNNVRFEKSRTISAVQFIEN